MPGLCVLPAVVALDPLDPLELPAAVEPVAAVDPAPPAVEALDVPDAPEALDVPVLALGVLVPAVAGAAPDEPAGVWDPEAGALSIWVNCCNSAVSPFGALLWPLPAADPTSCSSTLNRASTKPTMSCKRSGLLDPAPLVVAAGLAAGELVADTDGVGEVAVVGVLEVVGGAALVAVPEGEA